MNVTRVHNRWLRNRFEKQLTSVVDTSDSRWVGWVHMMCGHEDGGSVGEGGQIAWADCLCLHKMHMMPMRLSPCQALTGRPLILCILMPCQDA